MERVGRPDGLAWQPQHAVTAAVQIRYAGGAKIEMIHVGAPTRGDQQMRTVDRGFAAITADGKLNLAVFVCLNPASRGFKSHINSVFSQNFIHLFGHVAVLTR